ncbi:MAG: hypothetical protein ABI539_10780 [Acidobacteriota bacterium]
MVKRHDRSTVRNPELPAKTEYSDIHANTTRTRSAKTFKEALENDEMIVTLSEAYENKRARQVGEWERAQLTNVHVV